MSAMFGSTEYLFVVLVHYWEDETLTRESVATCGARPLPDSQHPTEPHVHLPCPHCLEGEAVLN